MSMLLPSLKCVLGRAIVLLLLTCWTNVAWAEKEQFAYDLSFSCSKPLLESGGSSMSTNAMASDLIGKYNNPWLKLTNTSEDATLNKFVISIGDDDFNYSMITLGNKVGTFDVDVNIIDGGKNLELVFANFNPGETVYVKFQIRPDDASDYQFPDFRTVLFDANGNSTADNAAITAVFNDPVTKQDDTITGKLPDFDTSGNSNLPSGCPRCMCFALTNSSTIDAFNFSQSNNLVPPPVPEPSSWLLMLLGSALALGSYRLRKLRPA